MVFLSCNAITGSAGQITAADCMLLLGQLKRIGYFELPQSAPIGDATTALAKATYDALLAASDNTKMIMSKNKVYGPELTGTEPVKVGSNDNSTPDGGSILRGQTVPMLKGKYTGLTPTQYKDYGKLFGRGNKSADFETLGGVFFCGETQVMMNAGYKPIPFKCPFIGDPTGMQLHDLTQFAFELEFVKNWFADVIVFDLNFNHNLL